MAELSTQEWPGNIRELESTIKRWLVLGKQGQRMVPMGGDAASGESPKQTRVSDLSPEQILARLEACQWNRRKAADSLGISYQALRRRIEKFKLNEQR